MKKHLKKVLYLITAGVFIYSCTKSEIIPTEVQKVIKKVVVKEVTKEVINEVVVEVIKEVPTPPTENGSTPTLSMAALTAAEIKEQGKEMLTEADDEIIDGEKKIFNEKYRSFYVNEMLSIKLQENGKYLIQNYLPHHFKNVKVLGKIKNVEMSPLVLATFETYPAFYELEKALPFNSQKDSYFNDTDGVLVASDSFDKIPVGDWEITLQSDDPIFVKMSNIKFILHYRYGEYRGGQESGKWDRIRWRDARAYSPLILNIAYLFNTDEFKNAILNYDFIFYNDEAQTAMDKERVYNSFVNKVDGKMRERRQSLGIITEPGTGGLGGGESFGVRREYINNPNGGYYSLERSGYWHLYPIDTWFHEFAHVAGYGHDGNMTYPKDKNNVGIGTGDILNGWGFTPVCMRLYRKMLENKELPFNEYPLDENYNPKN